MPVWKWASKKLIGFRILCNTCVTPSPHILFWCSNLVWLRWIPYIEFSSAFFFLKITFLFPSWSLSKFCVHTLRFRFLKFIFFLRLLWVFENSLFFCKGNECTKKEGVDAIPSHNSNGADKKAKKQNYVRHCAVFCSVLNPILCLFITFHWRTWFASAAKGNSNKRNVRNVARIKFPNENSRH